MLKLSGTLRNASSRLTPMSPSWRKPLQQLSVACSSAANPSPEPPKIKQKITPQERKSRSEKAPELTSQNPMVQAAFDTLKVSWFGRRDMIANDASMGKLKTSQNVRGLLKMVDKKSITPENARALVTLLINWVNTGEAKLSDFELDNRFLYLCDKISRSNKQTDRRLTDKTVNTKKYFDEFHLFYGINDIDEATKAVANITLKQMIKVMSALAQQKRRTTPLLRALSFNISRSPELMNIKQLSDLLYSMSVLNYPDEVLLQKISNDLTSCVSSVDKSAVIGSILTSLGILRYKNEQLLDDLCTWVVKHSNDLRSQHLCSFFMTLAMLGHTPANVECIKTVLVDQLKESDMVNPAEWLDIVWALVVLQLAENHHVASVLNDNFISTLKDGESVSVAEQQKLLNIHGAARFVIPNYNGPFLNSNSEIFTPPIRKSKEKQVYARSVMTALVNLYPPPEYLKLDVNSRFGFFVDAELCTDAKGVRLPVGSDLKTRRGFRIAVISLSYSDFCRGQQDPLGYHKLSFRILESQGFKILSIPYTEYSMEDKIVHRVSYIMNRIKNLVAT